MGTVFDSASGIRFPDRVESTRIMLPHAEKVVSNPANALPADAQLTLLRKRSWTANVGSDAAN